MKQRLIGIVAAGILVLGPWARQADARSAAQLRLEGAAIALGTVGLIAVLSEAVQAQPVTVAVGGWYPSAPEPAWGFPPPPAPPPPPPRPRAWVPGHWETVEVWVPGVAAPSLWRGGDCRDDEDHHRGYGGRGHRRDDHRTSRSHAGRKDRGHFERQRVWKEGSYR